MLPKRGRPGIALLMSTERQLDARDIFQLAQGQVDGQPVGRKGPPMVQRLKARHHAAARLLAAGLTIRQVSIKTGYTAQRIGDMQRTDPAFQNLIGYYKDMITELDLDDAREMEGMWRGIGLEALDEIQERLSDDKKREQIPIGELRQLATAAADRTDSPIKAAQPNVVTPQKITIKLGPRDIQPKLIEHEDAEPLKLENKNEQDD